MSYNKLYSCIFIPVAAVTGYCAVRWGNDLAHGLHSWQSGYCLAAHIGIGCMLILRVFAPWRAQQGGQR